MNKSNLLCCKQFLLALVFYAVVLVLSLEAISKFDLGWWRIPITIAPVLPALWMLRTIVGYIGRMDELQLRIQLQALAFAFAGTAVLTFTYGFLQNVGFPNVNWIWVWPVMCFLWIIGQLGAQRRYQ